MRRRRIAAAAVGLGLLATAAPAATQEDDRPSVTAAVQVTDNRDPNRAHSTPQMAVNPVTGEIVIGSAEVRTRKTCDIHISADGGRSWAPGGDPMMRPFTDCSQQATNGPYITFQFLPDGVLWAAFFASDPKYAVLNNRIETPRHVFVARSQDSGRTWETMRAYEGKEGDPGIGNSRRAQIAVDPGDPQNVYVGWQRGAASGTPRRAFLSVSHDGGRTWADPQELSDGRGGDQPRPVVDRNGVVHVIFPADGFRPPGATGDPEIRPMIYRRSTDRGRTWSPMQEIDPGNAGFSFMRKPMLAIDLESGTLHLTWYGNPNPRARRPPAGQPSTDEFDDRDIYLRTSTDGGATWGDRVTVNDDANRPNVQHYDSGIAVAPNGRVDAAWYDFRNSPVPEFEASGGNAGGSQDVYFSWSGDDGRSFAPNVRVTDRIIDRSIGVWSNNVHSHTNVAVASTDAAAYVAWQDTRNGNATAQAEDIYFAAVRFGPVERAGSGGDDGAPAWLVVGASAAVGMGLTALLVLALSRRRSAATA
ncbi:MAG: sialidase family protein [Acidimicrobiia bacterium]